MGLLEGMSLAKGLVGGSSWGNTDPETLVSGLLPMSNWLNLPIQTHYKYWASVAYCQKCIFKPKWPSV
jgi:hypothetical protein